MRKLLLALAALGVGGAATATATPPRDSFNGKLNGVSGRARGGHGRVAIRVAVPDSGSDRRPLTLVFSTTACPGCLRLAGSAHGYLVRGRPPHPDMGTSYTVTASGTLSGLGRTNITGTIGGTGFIARGHESMSLELRARRQRISVTAVSEQVGGFSSP